MRGVGLKGVETIDIVDIVALNDIEIISLDIVKSLNAKFKVFLRFVIVFNF